MATPTRPTVSRQVSRVPGGFDTDEDLSPIKTSFDHDDFKQDEDPLRSQPTSAAQHHFKDDSLNAPSDDGSSMTVGEGDTFLQEKEMRMRLEDVDSTFLPDLSPAANTRTDESAIDPFRGAKELGRNPPLHRQKCIKHPPRSVRSVTLGTIQPQIVVSGTTTPPRLKQCLRRRLLRPLLVQCLAQYLWLQWMRVMRQLMTAKVA